MKRKAIAFTKAYLGYCGVGRIERLGENVNGCFFGDRVLVYYITLTWLKGNSSFKEEGNESLFGRK